MANINEVLNDQNLYWPMGLISEVGPFWSGLVEIVLKIMLVLWGVVSPTPFDLVVLLVDKKVK